MEFDDFTIKSMSTFIYSRLVSSGLIDYTEDGDVEEVEDVVRDALEASGFLLNEPYELSGPDDYSDDAEALASAGWGTDEDYGYHGD